MKPYIILGGTGHIGQAVVQALLDENLPVVVITSEPKKAADIESSGAVAVVADVRDTEKLKEIFKGGSRLFLLNPPAPPSSDTVAEETKNWQSVLMALAGSGLEWIVAESTYGAQPGSQIGDLGVLYEMESSLARQSVPFTILRGAYYYSNWDALLEAARKGELPTVYPAHFKLPMVAPQDIGNFAAELLTGPIRSGVIYSIEGPEHYSPADVAAAFQKALDRPVEAKPVPREGWSVFFQNAGYSKVSADYMTNMTDVTVNSSYQIPGPVKKGITSIEVYVTGLI